MSIQPLRGIRVVRPCNPSVEQRLRSAAEQVSSLLSGYHPDGRAADVFEVSKPAGADLAPRRRLNDGTQPDNREVVLVGDRMYFHEYLESFPPSPRHPPRDRWVDLGAASAFGC
jgi:hypothetical protein